MYITLTDEEVRGALLAAAIDKTQSVLGESDIDNTYFEVTTSEGEIEDIEQVKFVVDFK